MKLYRDQGIVLRTHKLGETDRIITILGQAHGKIRAVAKGVRRTTSRFGARLEPFSHIDCQFYEGKTLDIVTQVETIHPFGIALASDYDLYAAASVLIETADKIIVEEGEPDTAQYRLLVGGLASLAGKKHHPDLIVTAYLLRAIALAGFEITLRACAVCGTPGPHRSFHVASGGMVCSRCRPPGSASPPAQVVDLLDNLLTGSWESIDNISDHSAGQAKSLASAYAQWHLERHIKSLSFISE